MTKNNRNSREIANQIMGQVSQVKLRAFTLAEVLITLVIIGVVSVLVLPTIINKVQGYANKRAHMVFQSKIKTGIQLMTGSNALVGYQTTEQFVEQFKKYIKIAKTCDNEHLTECFNSKVTDLTGKEIEIKPGMKLMDLYGTALNGATDTNVNGIILQDGTNILLAYNTNCVQPQNGSVDLSCISMVYDTNGGSAPNKLSDGNTFAVNLGTKEDNSNLNTIKDVGQINAPQFGTPVGMTAAKCLSFNGTIDGASTISSAVFNNKCAIWKNGISWNEITSNACPTTNCTLTQEQLSSWCESKYGYGMEIPGTWQTGYLAMVEMQSAGVIFPGLDGGNSYWTAETIATDVTHAYYVYVSSPSVSSTKYGSNVYNPKTYTGAERYSICFGQLN